MTLLLFILLTSLGIVLASVTLDVLTNSEYTRERRAGNQHYTSNNHYVGRHRFIPVNTGEERKHLW